MYLGLLQKKSSALEGKVQEMSQREAHIQNLAGKVYILLLGANYRGTSHR